MQSRFFVGLTVVVLGLIVATHDGLCQESRIDSVRLGKDNATAEQLSESEILNASVIDEATLRGHVRFLADDLLEGRGPGSRGDALTQLYIATQYQTLGLEPVAASRSWLQRVPLVGVRTLAPPQVLFSAGDRSLALQATTDIMAVMGNPKTEASIKNAEVVFVGYGIQAPESDWDDFKGIDLSKAKIVKKPAN